MSKEFPGLTPAVLAEYAEDPATSYYVQPHWVYRYFQDDRLLYIGFTINPKRRDAGHRTGSPWYHLVTRCDLERHPHKWAAMSAESRAIRDESPAFNVQYNRRPDWAAIRGVARRAS
jgi:predicted GIY-YIG superfamily endonuclease